MNEEKKNRRGWVKTAAIVFLSVLLVLTFFSNTIMNATLPEVAIRTVTSGNINVQIRGTGTVKAAETYNVTVDESRKIRSVNVRIGDEVAPGDILMVLSDESSEELTSAQAQLKTAKENYQRLLYDTSVRSAQRNLNDAQEALNEAKAKLAGKENYAEELEKAQAAVDEAKAALAAAENDVKTVNSELKSLAKQLRQYAPALSEVSEESLDALRELMSGSSDEVRTASVELEIISGRYKRFYDAVVAEAERVIKQTEGYKSAQSKQEQQKYIADRLDVYTADERAKIERGTSDIVIKWNISEPVFDDYGTIVGWQPAVDREYQAQLIEGYDAYKKALDAYNTAVKNYGYSQGRELPDFIEKCSDTLKTLNLAVEDTEAKTTALTEAQSAYEKLKNTDYENLEREIKQLERSVTDAKTSYNLASFNYTNEINDAKAAIEELENQVERFAGIQTGTEIRSEINGVVKSINVSSGGKTMPNDTLISIEVPDRGYTAEMSVTIDQAQRVMIGDTAEVQTGWWWGARDINARLIAIRTDPQTARTNRVLVFDVTGSDVNSGDNLTLTIGERSRSFDTIVPKSAMRSDSNGDFVLMVVARQNPIGNRYIAQRIDVTKLAEDDLNVAVSGDLSYNDSVITTTTAPIESGMQVRLAGN